MQIAPRWLIGGPYSYRAGGDVPGKVGRKNPTLQGRYVISALSL
jgi:hypothetical protein